MKTYISSKNGKKLIILAIALMLMATGCTFIGKKKTLSADEVKTKAEKFVNENLLQPGSKATISDVKEEYGLYKMSVNLSGGQKVDSYMTKDGSQFFPQSYAVDTVADKNADTKDQQAASNAQQNEDVKKTDKPTVELFVMSHCPYGTQIEKGIIPVVEALGSKINFQLKFCDYAMHGEKEVKEELNQTCIAKEQGGKMLTYLKCFLKDETKSDQCMKEAKIDTGKLKTCVAKIDKEFNVIKQLNDKSTWVSGQFPPFGVYAADNEKYGIKGSPGMVVNGTTINNSPRDPAGLLASICNAFNKKPGECDKKLSSDTPSPGFGEGAAAATSAGGCAN
jgi:hypothetical protein